MVENTTHKTYTYVRMILLLLLIIIIIINNINGMSNIITEDRKG